MGTLWVADDEQTAARRNREAILRAITGVPIYDVDDALSVTLTPVVTRAELGSSIGDVWAVPSGIAAAVVTKIAITNTDSSAHAVSLYLIEPGQTVASVARSIVLDTVQPGETVTIGVPIVLDAEATIRGLAASGSVVGVTVTALTFDDQPTGLALKVVEGVALTGALATLYTAPAGEQAIVLSALICNTDSTSRRPEVHVVPSGGSADVDNQVWKDALVSKETANVAGGESLAAGDFIQGKASVTSVVSARLSIVEVA